jgi:hypothetical protein
MHLKHMVRDFTINNHQEFVKMDYFHLMKVLSQCLTLDESLSLRFQTLIYRLFDHLCALYSNHSLASSLSAVCQRNQPLKLPYGNVSTTLNPSPGTWLYFQEDSNSSWKVLDSDVVTHKRFRKLRKLRNVQKPKSVAEKNIYYNPKRNGYVVDLIRQGKRYKKLFLIKTFGLEQAKLRALQFRDSFEAPVVRKPQKKQSQYKGVYFNSMRNTWVGSVQFRYTRTKKEFSVRTHGDKKAEQMAMEWRVNVLTQDRKQSSSNTPTATLSSSDIEIITNINIKKK